jgi:hypothetical protein
MSTVSEERFQSFNEFWPYYLSEHNVPKCRHVHFIGTNGFVAYLMYLSIQDWRVLVAFILSLLLGWLAFKSEAKRNASWALLMMVALMTWVESSFIYGVIFAYFFAWVGHFLIEHNRPATFKYTLWSLASDFKMCGQMWRGQLWTGSTKESLGV